MEKKHFVNKDDILLIKMTFKERKREKKRIKTNNDPKVISGNIKVNRWKQLYPTKFKSSYQETGDSWSTT